MKSKPVNKMYCYKFEKCMCKSQNLILLFLFLANSTVNEPKLKPIVLLENKENLCIENINQKIIEKKRKIKKKQIIIKDTGNIK